MAAAEGAELLNPLAWLQRAAHGLTRLLAWLLPDLPHDVLDDALATKGNQGLEPFSRCRVTLIDGYFSQLLRRLVAAVVSGGETWPRDQSWCWLR
jgi:hypothetical protein